MAWLVKNMVVVQGPDFGMICGTESPFKTSPFWVFLLYHNKKVVSFWRQGSGRRLLVGMVRFRIKTELNHWSDSGWAGVVVYNFLTDLTHPKLTISISSLFFFWP